MKLSSKFLAIVIVAVLFGGIIISDQMGIWQTESSKQAAVFSEGEFAGIANPADIRGSYTFDDVTKNFGIPVEILADAFNVQTGNAGSFPVKELETTYENSPVEIGTSSVRLFAAFYIGLPYDLEGVETYLPQRAVEILLERPLTEERREYLINHTATAPSQTENTTSGPVQPTITSTAVNTGETVKGKTTFAEMMGWGISSEKIEQILGVPMPEDTQMTIKDFATAEGLDFESVRTNLQTVVDKAK